MIGRYHSRVADWYVYQHDGDYLGPWSTETVADAILKGKLGADVWVAAPGGQRWLRALDVPVIARLIEGVPTRPRRRDSGLRLMPTALNLTAPLDDVDSAAQTMKMPAMRIENEPPTDPGMPPMTPTPTPPSPRYVGGGATLESAGNRRRRKNG